MYLLGLSIGLFGSLHCLGMCGPIAFALPIGTKNTHQRVVAVSLYHVGRIVVYGTIGLLVSLIGQGLIILQLQDVISVFSGISLLLITFWPKNYSAQNWLLFRTFNQFVFIRLKSLYKTHGKTSFLVLGICNGLLPCGFVYMALIYALVQATTLDALMIMLMFGLGTVPMMTIAVFWRFMLPLNIRNKWQRLIPILVSILAILLILRGLRLNIPMISPSTPPDNTWSSGQSCKPPINQL